MAQYVVRRMMWSIVMLVLVIASVFVIFFVMPGGAGGRTADGQSLLAIKFAGKNPRAEVVDQVEKRLGLDQPVVVQFGRYVGNAFTGDLGYSYQTQEDVLDALLGRFPATAGLALGASVLWLAIGVSIGIISALKRRSLLDRGSMLFALIGVSMPTFWLGLIAVFTFDAGPIQALQVYDTGSYVPFTENPWEWFKVMWLPWFVLAFTSAAIYARMVRGNLLEVQGEDYIRTARAKGLREKSVTRHALRSALTPIVTMYGLDLGILLGGAVITEQIFNIPGIGSYAVGAIRSQNFPIILGTTVFAAGFVIIANLVVDILYAALDPRVRYS
ncbi:MAG TPA: ABC transporter permease [Actinomycetota bacterium]|nr:ABC transporter permease [Actinomycetota bacterium]